MRPKTKRAKELEECFTVRLTDAQLAELVLLDEYAERFALHLETQFRVALPDLKEPFIKARAPLLLREFVIYHLKPLNK